LSRIWLPLDKTGHQFKGFQQVSDLKKSFQLPEDKWSNFRDGRGFTSLQDLSVKFWLELELMFGQRT
jgi:hypothetical protein